MFEVCPAKRDEFYFPAIIRWKPSTTFSFSFCNLFPKPTAMPSNEELKQKALDFLFEEYREVNNTIHINEERGEKRLEFFIGLSTIVLGALGLLVKEFEGLSKSGFLPLVYIVVIMLLGGLILIGINIMNRLKKRNETTYGLKYDVSAIRQLIRNATDPAHTIIPETYAAFKNSNFPAGKAPRRFYRFAGLLQIVAVINSILVGTATTFLLFALRPGNIGITGIILVSAFACIASGLIFLLRARNIR
jgi:hypothetical protein